MLNTLFFERQTDSESMAKVLQKDVPSGRKGNVGTASRTGTHRTAGEKRATAYHLSVALYQRFHMKAEYIRARASKPLQHEQMVISYARKHGKIAAWKRRNFATLAPIRPRDCCKRLPKNTRNFRRLERKKEHTTFGKPANYERAHNCTIFMSGRSYRAHKLFMQQRLKPLWEE